MGRFNKNHQKIEKWHIFAQNSLEPTVSGHSKFTDDIVLSPAPTAIVPAIEMHSTTAILTKNQQKLRKSTILCSVYCKRYSLLWQGPTSPH